MKNKKICNVCECHLSSLSSHKKTDKHKYNYLAKVNKLNILPLDLQRIIIEYLYCFYASNARPFRKCIRNERSSQDYNCHLWHTKFYEGMMRSYYEIMQRYEVELFTNLRDIEIDNIDAPSYYIYGYCNLRTDTPMRNYLKNIRGKHLNKLVNKYANHKYM